MSENGNNGESPATTISAELGSLNLQVTSENPQDASELFDAKLDRLLEEAEDMSKALRDGSRSVH